MHICIENNGTYFAANQTIVRIRDDDKHAVAVTVVRA